MTWLSPRILDVFLVSMSASSFADASALATCSLTGCDLVLMLGVVLYMLARALFWFSWNLLLLEDDTQ